MNKIAFYCTILVGLLLVLSFFLHAFAGVSLLNETIHSKNIGEETALHLKMGWIWSSVTVLILGVWCFFIAPSVKKGVLRARAQIFLLGLGLSVFGLGAFLIQRDFNHYVFYGFEGFVLLLPSLFLKNEEEESNSIFD